MMRRTIIGWLFIVHGMAHSALGLWSSSLGPPWLVTPLWWVAQVGFVAAGLGLIGIDGLRRVWAPLALAAGLSSIALLSIYGHIALMTGLVIDLLVIVLGLQWGERTALERLRGRTPAPDLHPTRHTIATVLAGVALVYMSAVILVRPWQLTWGTTPEQRIVALPGDDLVRDAHYRMDRAILIAAPADSVWPWLVQIGQDRAGFYSYDRLERLFGAHIRNADQVRPEWQVRQAGELVRAVQPDYLGGRFGADLGWRVAEVVPGRAIVMEQWGAFVLVPVDANTTRLQIRLRGDGSPSVLGSLVAPIGVFVFEPAHFIMERGMLRGIRRRAEQRGLSQGES
jgi:hypothetical protein